MMPKLEKALFPLSFLHKLQRQLNRFRFLISKFDLPTDLQTFLHRTRDGSPADLVTHFFWFALFWFYLITLLKHSDIGNLSKIVFSIFQIIWFFFRCIFSKNNIPQNHNEQFWKFRNYRRVESWVHILAFLIRIQQASKSDFGIFFKEIFIF